MILKNWFKACTLIYNETLNYIKTTFPFTKNAITKKMIIGQKNFYNSYSIRNKMKEIKNKIQKDFSFVIDKEKTISKKKNIKCAIDIHTLDKTIFQLTQNIKSAVSNVKNGNFKCFRMKYWKYTRPSQTIELEKSKIKDGIFCKNIFKDLPKIAFMYNNQTFNLSQIECDFKINYNSITDKYTLMVPMKTEYTLTERNDNIVVLDPGLRTFMTGISNTEYLSIGNDIHSKIKTSLCRLNKIKNNKDIPDKIKKKNERLINRKIENKVNEMHWKIIDYLTWNYSAIFLGDMSAKSIVKKSSSVLSKVAKVACLRMKFYEFRLRLMYKCSVRNIKFKLMDEFYTSKTCSVCGNYNDTLKGEIEYHCKECETKIHRDINGCRNIYMKQYL
jgi:transposase